MLSRQFRVGALFFDAFFWASKRKHDMQRSVKFFLIFYTLKRCFKGIWIALTVSMHSSMTDDALQSIFVRLCSYALCFLRLKMNWIPAFAGMTTSSDLVFGQLHASLRMMHSKRCSLKKAVNNPRRGRYRIWAVRICESYMPKQRRILTGSRTGISLRRYRCLSEGP
jgi:hypothetical protein